MSAATTMSEVDLVSAPARMRAKRAVGRRRWLTVKPGLPPGQKHLINGGESPPPVSVNLFISDLPICIFTMGMLIARFLEGSWP